MRRKLMRKLFLFALIVTFMTAGSSMVYAASDADAGDQGNAIISPYWQSNGAGVNDIYTFIAITNPSISGNLSRAVTVKAINNSGTSEGAVSAFTISPGTTHRIFIAATNHATINSTSITASDAHFIGTTTSATRGHLVIQTPYVHIADGGVTASGIIGQAFTLSVWGAVYDPSSQAGFAMEFIGDMGDSGAGMLNGVTTGN